MINPLIGKLKVKQAEIQLALCQGVISWDVYSRMVGEHQGLQTALDIIYSMLDEEKNLD